MPITALEDWNLVEVEETAEQDSSTFAAEAIDLGVPNGKLDRYVALRQRGHSVTTAYKCC